MTVDARGIRGLVGLEGATYIAAALAHAGILIEGYEHARAVIAEALIAAVLVGGLLIASVRPSWTRGAALWSQSFALFWTCVGMLTIALGVGPRTGPDVVYHLAIIAVLIWGLGAARSINGPPLRSEEVPLD